MSCLVDVSLSDLSEDGYEVSALFREFRVGERSDLHREKKVEYFPSTLDATKFFASEDQPTTGSILIYHNLTGH